MQPAGCCASFLSRPVVNRTGFGTPTSSSWRDRYPWWRWAVVAAYMGAIFVESSMTGLSLPARVSDKVAHAGLYAVLSALLVWALTNGEWRRITGWTVLLATVAAILYGWTDEFHQLFVPSRQYEWLDLAADATGALAGACVLWGWGIISRGTRP